MADRERCCTIVLICDDSSLMNKFVKPGPVAPSIDLFNTAELPTRWTELRNTWEIVIDLACDVSDNIDVYFLHHIGDLKGIRTPEELHLGFPTKPHGYIVPLARAIRDVIASNQNLQKGKKIIIRVLSYTKTWSLSC